MKNIIKLFITSISFLAFMSCEEIIDIELNTTESKVVIEATITDEKGPYFVNITKTGDYFEPGGYSSISGAQVIISDDKGIVDTCVEVQQGVYQTTKIEGRPNTSYSLYVQIENEEYTARTYMPEKVKLDSLSYMFTEAMSPNGKDGYLIKCQFTDPEGEDNYYRIATYKNGEFFLEAGNEIIIWDDVLFEGENADIPAKRAGEMFSVGDTISVELLCINHGIFQYYTSLINALASGSSGIEGMGKNMIIGAAAPANPPTNLSNGAVGYFAAYTISKQTVVIEE